MIATERVERGTEPERDVGPALAAGRPEPEAAELPAQRPVLGVAGLDAIAREAVEQAELLLAEALVEHDVLRRAAHGGDELGGACGAQVRRRDHDVGPLVGGQLREPPAQRAGLLLAARAQGHVDVAVREVELVRVAA